MNKRLLAVAVAGAFVAGSAIAAPAPTVSISGWGESILSISSDFGKGHGLNKDGDPANSETRKFETTGELDFNVGINDQLSARVDVDINNQEKNLFSGSYTSNSLQMEQLFAAWKANDMFGVRLGRFNNPLNYESQDKPELATITHGLIFDTVAAAVQGAPSAYNNNLEGVALDFNVGPAVVTLGGVNEIYGVDNQNSWLAQVKAQAMPGLDLSLGLLSGQKTVGTAPSTTQDTTGNLIDFNAAYSLNVGMPLKVWAEYLDAQQDVKNAWGVGASLWVADMFEVVARYEDLKWDRTPSRDDNKEVTVAVAARPVEHLDVKLEWRQDKFQAGTMGLTDTSKDKADRVLLSGTYTF
jgi:hypothetical protein